MSRALRQPVAEAACGEGEEAMFGSGHVQKFNQGVAQKTGLQAQGDRFVGTFQGFPAWCKCGPVADAVGAMRGQGGALGGLGALIGGTTGGMAQMMTGGAFFMKHDYVVSMPGLTLPGASLRTPSSFLSDKTYQMRGAVGAKTSSGVAWIDKKFEVCAVDPRFVQALCANPEFQQVLQRWPAPMNLSFSGQEVWLEILDSPTRINSWFNTSQQQNGDMIAMGMHVVGAGARAAHALLSMAAQPVPQQPPAQPVPAQAPVPHVAGPPSGGAWQAAGPPAAPPTPLLQFVGEAGQDLAFRARGIPVGAPLKLGTHDAAVFIAHGAFVGLLSEGEHVLAAGAVPFLASLPVGPAGFEAELYLIRGEPLEVGVELTLSLADGKSARVVAAIDAECAQAVKLCTQISGQGGDTAHARTLLVSALQRGFASAIDRRRAEGLPDARIARRELGAIDAEVAQAANAELEPAGIEIPHVRIMELQFPEAQPSAPAVAPGARVQVPWTNGATYTGVVLAVSGDQVHVQWEGGQGAGWVPANQVRPA